MNYTILIVVVFTIAGGIAWRFVGYKHFTPAANSGEITVLPGIDAEAEAGDEELTGRTEWNKTPTDDSKKAYSNVKPVAGPSVK